MMKKASHRFFLTTVLASFLLFFAFDSALVSDKKVLFHLITKKQSFVAGQVIVFNFYCQTQTEKPQLLIIHSYGKTVIDPVYEKGNYFFKIPDNYSKKSGHVSWFLIHKSQTVTSGFFDILSNDSTKTIIENYLGPRTILAGAKEFTMMVTVPTDGFDNPKNDNTAVLLKYQFLQKITNINLKTKDFFAWHDIYSPTKSGKMLVSTSCNAVDTKEIETEIYPNLATDFTINYTRNHDFADGNQITHFSTSIIKDQFNNIVSDGTLITFLVKTNNNMILKTFGSTIGGRAVAEILHPDHQETYKVKAYVFGMAESNNLIINYKSITSTFDYTFADNKRTIVVGPVKSFMNQIVPDGVKITLKIFNKNTLITTLQDDTYKGKVIFKLSKDFYPAKNYRFEISTLGIIKKTETINYELNQQ